MDSTTIGNLLALAGLFVGLIGGVLGVFSIVVTWKLYQAGTRLSLKTMEVLSEIKASSRTTEVTSTHFTERLVTALVELQGRDINERVAVANSTAATRIRSIIDGVLGDSNAEALEKAKRKIEEELSDSFRAIKFEASQVSRLSSSPTLSDEPKSEHEKIVVAPGVPRLLEWIVRNEDKYDFFSVKWLREKVFGSDVAVQEALQFALDYKMLDTYERHNPKNPSWPTTACTLNRGHPVVKKILAQMEEA